MLRQATGAISARSRGTQQLVTACKSKRALTVLQQCLPSVTRQDSSDAPAAAPGSMASSTATHSRYYTRSSFRHYSTSADAEATPLKVQTSADPMAEYTQDQVFESAILPWECRKIGEWLVEKYRDSDARLSIPRNEFLVLRLWALGCINNREKLDELWAFLPAELKEMSPILTGYLCARIWCGDTKAPTEYLEHQLDQAQLEDARQTAIDTRHLLRALAWTVADHGEIDESRHIAQLRQRWLLKYEGKFADVAISRSEPVLIAMQLQFAILQRMMTTPYLTDDQLHRSTLPFMKLLEDTRRNPNFQRNLNFYNLLIRCNNAIAQLRERLGLKPMQMGASVILEEMQADGITPNRYTYHLLMEGIAYSRMPFPDNFEAAWAIARYMTIAGEEKRVSKTYELLLHTFPLSRSGYRFDVSPGDPNAAGEAKKASQNDGYNRLMRLEQMMLNEDHFAHTTATFCASLYRLGAMGRFSDIRNRIQQMMDAGVHLEREHYEVISRICGRHHSSSQFAIDKVYWHMLREDPPVLLDVRMILGYLNCCARVRNHQMAIELLKKVSMESVPINPNNMTHINLKQKLKADAATTDDGAAENESVPDATRDWNNCLRPIVELCRPPGTQLDRSNEDMRIPTSLNSVISHQFVEQERIQTLRKLAHTVVIPQLTAKASPHPLCIFYVYTDRNLPAAIATIERHITAREGNVPFGEEGLDVDQDLGSIEHSALAGKQVQADTEEVHQRATSSTNPAYFVQVTRSYTDVLRAQLQEGDLKIARYLLASLLQFYRRQAAGLRITVASKRHYRPWILPDWSLLSRFALQAIDANTRQGDDYARWALAVILPEFRALDGPKRTHTLDPKQPIWIRNVERQLAERAANLGDNKRWSS